MTSSFFASCMRPLLLMLINEKILEFVDDIAGNPGTRIYGGAR